MANPCSYSAKITGEKKSVEEFCRIMRAHEMPGVLSCELWGQDFLEDGSVSQYIDGICAWSVLLSMMRGETNLKTESRRLHLKIEVFSSEPGFAFQEHFLIKDGEAKVEECVEYHEYDASKSGAVEELNKVLDASFTSDDIGGDGYIHAGGFGQEYGNFQ